MSEGQPKCLQPWYAQPHAEYSFMKKCYLTSKYCDLLWDLLMGGFPVSICSLQHNRLCLICTADEWMTERVSFFGKTYISMYLWFFLFHGLQLLLLLFDFVEKFRFPFPHLDLQSPFLVLPCSAPKGLVGHVIVATGSSIFKNVNFQSSVQTFQF